MLKSIIACLLMLSLVACSPSNESNGGDAKDVPAKQPESANIAEVITESEAATNPDDAEIIAAAGAALDARAGSHPPPPWRGRETTVIYDGDYVIVRFEVPAGTLGGVFIVKVHRETKEAVIISMRG